MHSKTNNLDAELVTEREDILQMNFDHTLFSWSPQKKLNPIAVRVASGVYLYDYDDKEYIDFCSGLVNVNIGHGHQRITDAVIRQMNQVSYVSPSCVTKVRGELGKKLASICPGDINKAFFTVCGASAIENAIKLARLKTGRYKVITRYQSYHGASYGALSASGDPRRIAMDAQQSPNFVHIDIPVLFRWEYGEENLLKEAVASLERVLAFEGPQTVAAILLEGESGSSGCLKYPAGYLKAVREICSRHGILLIIDEVMSGFGRTGKWFGFQNHDIIPDMIAMAKGLTSGYLPFGCLMVSDAVASMFDNTTLPLGLTYSAHPVCCAAALETLKIYEDENLFENTIKMGSYIQDALIAMKTRHHCIGDVRMTGLLGCIELVKNTKTNEPMAPFNAKPAEMKIMDKIASAFRENGMYAYVRWNFIFIAPPLCINKDESDRALAIIDKVLTIADRYTI